MQVYDSLIYTHTQHVCLDHLNLRLADTEFSVEAFEAFRSAQLQASPAYILDPSTALPHRVDLTEKGGGRVGQLGAGGDGELGDLLLVRQTV